MEKLDIHNITTYQAGAAQASIHRLLQKLSDDILTPYGITKMQWMIIGTVFDSGKAGVRISDLADNLSTTLPYLTTSINLLESKKILIRKNNAKDSRSKLVTVSTSFAPKFEQIEKSLRDGLRESIYAKVEPKDLNTYIKVLYQLREVGKNRDKR